MKTDVWQNVPIDRHSWAFYYYCKRQGDKVRIEKNGDGTMNIYVNRKEKK